jgi:hypothetical protein
MAAPRGVASSPKRPLKLVTSWALTAVVHGDSLNATMNR